MADYAISVDTKDLEAALKRIRAEQDAVTAATEKYGKDGAKAYRAVQAEAKRAAKGPSEWTLALRENSAALNDTKSQINQAAEATGKLAAAASLLDPRLGAVVQTLQKLEGVASASVTAEQLLGGAWVEGATAAGALTLAVSPLVLALYDLERASTAAAEAQKILQEAQDDELPLIESALDAYTELAIKTSGLTEAEQARAEVARAWDRKLAETNAKTKERLELAQAELDQMAKTDAAYVAQIDLVAGLKKQIAENNETAAQGLAAALATLEYTQEQAAADKKVTEAKKERTAATKDLNAVERELDKTEQMARERKAKEDREAVEAEMKRRKDLQDAYLKMVEERTAAEKKAAEDAAAAQTAAIAGITGQISAATAAVKDYYGEESNAGKAAAWLELGLAEAELLAKGATFGPGAGLYIAAGQIPLALAAAKLAGLGAGEPDATVTDTPRPLQAGPAGATIRVAPFDKVVAARRDDDLRAQVGGGGGGSMSVALMLNGRTLQAVTSAAKKGQRREGRTQPTGQRRRTG